MSKVSDLINEKWIIKNKNHLSKEDYERLAEIETELKEIKKIIQKAFSQKQKKFGEWIPVSERLPEDGQRCLVTTKGMFGDSYCEIASYSNNLYKIDKYDFNDKRNVSGFYNYDNEYGFYEDANITAWLPLPEPYKAEMEVE